MTRTIALAVDGMEFSLLSKWIEQGELPNFKELQDKGAFGTANCSSLSSAKQWTTHFTGVDPAHHNISGFTKDSTDRIAGEPAPNNSELINLADIPVKTYPELLSEDGVSTGLINPLPIWPPLELTGGFCISGLLTPPGTDRWFTPPEVEEELDRFDYQIDIRYGSRPYGFVDDELFNKVSIDRIYEDIFDVLKSRIQYTKYCIENRSTEYLYVLLKSIDVIQHCFWAHMEEDDDLFGDAILDSYKLVDELTGWIQDTVNANLLVFGDHGFKARKTQTYPTIHRFLGGVSNHIFVPNILKQAYQSLMTQNESAGTGSNSVDSTTGTHANPATWLLNGPDVKESSRIDIAFEDISPMILTLLDCPIPNEYTGTPPKCTRQTPSYESVDLSVRRQLEFEENEIISERLHNLGYADMVDE